LQREGFEIRWPSLPILTTKFICTQYFHSIYYTWDHTIKEVIKKTNRFEVSSSHKTKLSVEVQEFIQIKIIHIKN